MTFHNRPLKSFKRKLTNRNPGRLQGRARVSSRGANLRAFARVWPSLRDEEQETAAFLKFKKIILIKYYL